MPSASELARGAMRPILAPLQQKSTRFQSAAAAADDTVYTKGAIGRRMSRFAARKSFGPGELVPASGALESDHFDITLCRQYDNPRFLRSQKTQSAGTQKQHNVLIRTQQMLADSGQSQAAHPSTLCERGNRGLRESAFDVLGRCRWTLSRDWLPVRDYHSSMCSAASIWGISVQ